MIAIEGAWGSLAGVNDVSEAERALDGREEAESSEGDRDRNAVSSSVFPNPLSALKVALKTGRADKHTLVVPDPPILI